MVQLLTLITLCCVVMCALLFICTLWVIRVYLEVRKHGSHLENPDSDEMP